MDREYFATIERAFLEHRGGLMLSPACARIITGWARASIPIDVVVDGISAGFERQRNRPIRALSDVEKDVDAALQRFHDRQVGQQAPAPTHIGEALDELRARFEARARDEDPVVRAVAREAVVGLRAFAELARTAALSEPVELLDGLANQLAATAVRAAPAAEAGRFKRWSGPNDRARLWREVREMYALPAMVIDLGGGW